MFRSFVVILFALLPFALSLKCSAGVVGNGPITVTTCDAGFDRCATLYSSGQVAVQCFNSSDCANLATQFPGSTCCDTDNCNAPAASPTSTTSSQSLSCYSGSPGNVVTETCTSGSGFDACVTIVNTDKTITYACYASGNCAYVASNFPGSSCCNTSNCNFPEPPASPLPSAQSPSVSALSCYTGSGSSVASGTCNTDQNACITLVTPDGTTSYSCYTSSNCALAVSSYPGSSCCYSNNCNNPANTANPNPSPASSNSPSAPSVPSDGLFCYYGNPGAAPSVNCTSLDAAYDRCATVINNDGTTYSCYNSAACSTLVSTYPKSSCCTGNLCNVASNPQPNSPAPSASNSPSPSAKGNLTCYNGDFSAPLALDCGSISPLYDRCAIVITPEGNSLSCFSAEQCVYLIGNYSASSCCSTNLCNVAPPVPSASSPSSSNGGNSSPTSSNPGVPSPSSAATNSPSVQQTNPSPVTDVPSPATNSPTGSNPNPNPIPNTNSPSVDSTALFCYQGVVGSAEGVTSVNCKEAGPGYDRCAVLVASGTTNLACYNSDSCVSLPTNFPGSSCCSTSNCNVAPNTTTSTPPTQTGLNCYAGDSTNAVVTNCGASTYDRCLTLVAPDGSKSYSCYQFAECNNVINTYPGSSCCSTDRCNVPSSSNPTSTAASSPAVSNSPTGSTSSGLSCYTGSGTTVVSASCGTDGDTCISIFNPDGSKSYSCYQSTGCSLVISNYPGSSCCNANNCNAPSGGITPLTTSPTGTSLISCYDGAAPDFKPTPCYGDGVDSCLSLNNLDGSKSYSCYKSSDCTTVATYYPGSTCCTTNNCNVPSTTPPPTTGSNPPPTTGSNPPPTTGSNPPPITTSGNPPPVTTGPNGAVADASAVAISFVPMTIALIAVL